MPRAEPPEEYLTPQEAAEILKVTPLTIRRWVKAGTLKATKIGRLWRIKRSDLDRALSADPGARKRPR